MQRQAELLLHAAESSARRVDRESRHSALLAHGGESSIENTASEAIAADDPDLNPTLDHFDLRLA